MTQPDAASGAATIAVRAPVVTVTTVLIAINVAAYLWEITSGVDFNDTRSLLAHGALVGVLVKHGEWWRIVTGGFLHGGLAHIAFNMFALYQLGRYVELVAGPWRMLAVYAVSLAGGGYAVAYFSPYDVTVGASGAIFGLFGALIAFGLRLGAPGRSLIGQMLPVLLINLAFTFAVPFVSKAGHLGGLLTGFIAGAALFTPRRRPPPPAVSVAAATPAIEPDDGSLAEPRTPG